MIVCLGLALPMEGVKGKSTRTKKRIGNREKRRGKREKKKSYTRNSPMPSVTPNQAITQTRKDGDRDMVGTGAVLGKHGSLVPDA